MKYIQGHGQRDQNEHFVIKLTEPTRIDFVNQIEDVLISSPEGDILFGFDYKADEDFHPNNAMLLKSNDNLKEFGKERCSHLYIMPKDMMQPIKPITVYIYAER